MKILIVFIVILTVPAFRAAAQTITPTVIASNGGFYQLATNSVAWTLGELVTSTVSNSSTTLTQGFHQPDYSIIIGTTDGIKDKISVYPNPFTEKIFIRMENSKGGYFYSVEDLTGRSMLAKTELKEISTGIDLNYLKAGVFLLSVYETNQIYTYRIIKTN